MASAPDAPKQQNPTIAAQQSALSNLQFSNAALTANRINSKNQNGEVKYVSSENFDSAAYNRAMADWQASRNIIGQTDLPMPTKNEFYTKTWRQEEVLNPALQEALTNQQLGNKVLSGSLQTLANKAKSSLNTSFNGPKLGDYTKGIPAFDQTKISQVSPVQSNTQLKSNLGTLPGINTSASQKVGQTNIDTNLSDNLKNTGTVKDSTTKAGSFVSGAKSLDQTVNTSGVGNVNNFGSSAKINNNLAEQQRGVGGVNNFQSSAKIDNNLADDMKNVGLVNDFSQRAGQFQTSANKVNQNFSSNGTKLDTNINDNFQGVKNLNQDGVKQVGQFTNNAGNIVSNVKNANLDTNISDNLKAAGVNTNQQTFNVGGSGVKTNVPQFDPNAAKVYQKAAYDAQNAWLAPQMEAQRKAEANRLALQGLGVDSEASKGAMTAVYDSQNRAQQALAASSYASGAEQARANYQTSLGGISQANDAEAQRYAQELQRFNTNLSAQNQAFNQQNTIFNQNNAANQQVFDNSLTQAQLNNAAQNQKFQQQNQTFANNLDAAKTNQSIINDSNAARSAAFNQSLQKFNAQNDARSQQFAQDQSAFNTYNAAQNQQFSQDQSRFNNSLASLSANADIAKMNNDFQNQRNVQAMNAFNANNQANQMLFGQDQARAQLNADLQNQRFSQSLQNFNTLNQANKDLFAQDQARATTNADLQNQRYTQALNTFNAQNAARGQQFAQSDAAFKNNLSALNFNADQIAQNNDAQNQRFAQALSAFNTQNQALKDQAAINANRVTTNADLQAADNAAAMQKQNWALQNANFYNQSQLAQNNIAQQNFQNKLQAQAANLDLRNANNSNRQQYLADALSRFQADNQYQLDNRYRALNEYNSLLAGTTPVSANSQYQNFAQQGQTGGVDYAGAAQQANASAMARYQAGVNQANATNQGLASLAGTVAMYAAMSSDKNLKTNIQQTGETASGRKTYSWDWNKKANVLGLEGSSEGVLAQENKDIAMKDPVTGYLAVDYSKLNTKKKKV